MTCPVTVHLGVYALGAADAAERVLVESHLPSCQVCRAELARLEPLPGLLARVPASLLPADPPPARHERAPLITAWKTRARRARPSARRWQGVTAMAAAAVLGASVGIWLGRPAANSPPTAITLSGANPVTHVRVTVTLTATSWGTSIRLQALGLPLNQSCRLIIRSRAGATEIVGAWDAWRSGPVSIPASAAWRPADIVSLRVATATRSLVTVTAVRPGPHGKSSAQPNGPTR